MFCSKRGFCVKNPDLPKPNTTKNQANNIIPSAAETNCHRDIFCFLSAQWKISHIEKAKRKLGSMIDRVKK